MEGVNGKEASWSALKTIADQGNNFAQALLGFGFWSTMSLDEANEYANKSFEWVRRTAAQENPPNKYAIWTYGFFLENGIATEINQEQAASLYRRAGEDFGLPIALYDLGNCYEFGHGVNADRMRAFRCYITSANGGHSMAQNKLGLIYSCVLQGFGIPDPDYSQAVYYFQQAADQGWASAQHSLGVYYYQGLGVEAQDINKAVYYIRLAAAQGRQESQEFLRTINQA